MSKKCAASQIFFAYSKRSFKDLLFRRDSNLVQIPLYLVGTVLNRFLRGSRALLRTWIFTCISLRDENLSNLTTYKFGLFIEAFPFKEKIQAKNSLKQAQKKSHICVAFECFV